ncbi:MAG: hypothetical protein KBD56_00175 [Candidatus Eisenbacteria bacterium]|nr:hypothetical protein [Candidatus Eisenbacteria bacterium]
MQRSILRSLPAAAILCAVLLSCPVGSAARAAGDSWVFTASHDGALTAEFDLRPPSEAPGRLLVLPAGARTVELLSATDESGEREVPLTAIGMGPIMRMRKTPLVPLWIDPRVVESLKAQGSARIKVRLHARDEKGSTIEAGAGVLKATCADNRGGYLIIAADPYADALAPLVEWKRACGYEVTLALTSQTGRTVADIQAFVQNAYETWETPPLFLLLVADVEDIPSGDVLGNVSDQVYACVDGDDFLADIHVGRFAVKNAQEVAVQVAKTVGYESRPDTAGTLPADPETWFDRALMVAANHGSATPVPTCQWVREELERVGFSRVSEVYYPPFSDGCSQTYGCPIGKAINDGVSIVNYRGWARENPPGWDVPDYTTEDIAALTNGWKLPVVFSIVCNTGDFGRTNEDCFGEGWLKAGTVDAPAGAVAFVGTAEHWSRTRWNDRIDLSLFESFCYDGVRQLGPMLASAKASLLAYFPTEIYLEDVVEEEAVEFYNKIYNILGDPGLEIWTTRPRVLEVTGMPATIPAGTNCLSLQVVETDGGREVAGAHVACTQDGALIGYATTGASGEAHVAISLASNGPVECTVTGTDLYPWRASANIVPAERALTCTGADVINGLNTIIPGRVPDLFVYVRNTGSVPLSGVSATISAPPGVEVISGATVFAPIAVGATELSADPLKIRVAEDTENGARLRFLLHPEVNGEALASTEFRLTVVAPECVVQSMTDGGDGVFDAGEECDLVLTVRNDGAASGGILRATLHAPSPEAGIAVLDSSGTFSAIAPGMTGDNAADPFHVRLDGRLAAGTVIPLRLTFRGDDGPVVRAAAALVVGRVDGGAPIGPDAYGYYAYDSADIDYRAQAPAYRWVEISSRYDGPGTRLPIDIDDRVPQIVRLPFSFQYYGASYDSVLVSDNGWLAFDTTYFFDTRNWAMPDRWGGGCQVAAFWDNLNPMIAGTDGIYAWHDTEGHRFIVEWNRLRNFEESATNWQTFQIILYDPAWHATSTGDGEIVIQYKHIMDDDWKTMYSTVGIEDQSETIGLQYVYCNQYAPGAVPLAAGLAIRFTTDAPVYDPIAVDDFVASWMPGGGHTPERDRAGEGAGEDPSFPGAVQVRWDCDEEIPIAGFELLRASRDEAGATWMEPECVHAGRLPAATRCFTDPTADPGARYLYRLRAVATVGEGRTIGETVYEGPIGQGPALRLASANPSAAGAVLLLRANPGATAEVLVFDAAGRRVRSLTGEQGNAAARFFAWDGRDAAGRLVPSGVYWLRAVTGSETNSIRLAVVR